MTRSDALIMFIQSMSKSEKKAFQMRAKGFGTKSNYLRIYSIVQTTPEITADKLKASFRKTHTDKSFDTAVKYLYQILLDCLLELRTEQDSYYSLFDKILKARILFEKSMFEECFDMLATVKANSIKLENHYALLIASRLELEYLLALNFPGEDEKMLLQKHFKINESLRTIQKINQQSSLYDLLKLRVSNKGNIRSEKQKNELNDLVVSEMSIVASSNINTFEIKKLHQLFQANYLISVGDYKSALHSFYELNALLEKNKHLWATPPIYYLLTLEGVLDSLRGLHNYEGMNYFLDQLKKLETPFPNFNTSVLCVIFLYELFQYIDVGNFSKGEEIVRKYQNTLIKKSNLLLIARNAELSLYLAITDFGQKNYVKAKQTLSKIIFVGKSYSSLPLYRTIRLVNLLILYETKDFDLIRYETRSIKREMKVVAKEYKIERRILGFVNSRNIPISAAGRKTLWEKMEKEFDVLRHDAFEQQTLKLFDFTAWIESKVRKVPLDKILASRFT